MKYFTNKWFDENTSDDELDAIRNSYWDSLKKTSNKFSNHLNNLAFNTNLHDGIIYRIILDKKNSKLDLFIRIGDLQDGYEDLQIKYQNFSLDKLSKNMLKDIIDKKDLEILYDELSLKNGGFLHNLLFSNHKEIKIFFSSIEISKKKFEDRSINEKSFIIRTT